MPKEKVIDVRIPEGAKHRKVKTTADGVTYTAIPKPVPLIGGTEVYQKDNGTGYWYCKIKEGRDEFMCLYFGDLTKGDLIYDAKGDKRKFDTIKQKKLKKEILKALNNKPEEGFRWIPVYEPSKDDNGNVQYVSGEKVLIGEFCSYEWEEVFDNYSPENGSREASITTCFLLLLRWIKDGVATIEQLADNSEEIGHYWGSKNEKHDFEKTGEREFGGLYGFVGNTYKEVKDSGTSSGFSHLGGRCMIKGHVSPVANVYRRVNPHYAGIDSVGLLELTM